MNYEERQKAICEQCNENVNCPYIPRDVAVMVCTAIICHCLTEIFGNNKNNKDDKDE